MEATHHTQRHPRRRSCHRRRNPPLNLPTPLITTPSVPCVLDSRAAVVVTHRSVTPRRNQQPHNLRPSSTVAPRAATQCSAVQPSFQCAACGEPGPGVCCFKCAAYLRCGPCPRCSAPWDPMPVLRSGQMPLALIPVGAPHVIGAAIGFILGDYLIWRD